MDEQKNAPSVPYIVYEGEQARNERHIKRLIIALVVTILLLFATNAIWLSAWMQYDYVGEEVSTTTQTVDVDAKEGVANYIGRDGDIVNGENSSNDYYEESSEES